MISDQGRDYLQEQTIAEIVKNALKIYRKYFKKFFGSYFLLMLPATGLALLGFVVFDDSAYSGLLLYLTVGFVAFSVASLLVTVVGSDICLGEPPSIKRAWKHISARLISKLVVTRLIFYSIFIAAMIGVFLLLIWLSQSKLPSWGYLLYAVLVLLLLLALITLFLFLPAIVVVENRWGFRALKRSVTLGYGYHLRNFVIVIMMFVLVTLLPVILWVISFVIDSNRWGPLLGICLFYVVGRLIQPLGLIYILLLYYDLRVRKEGYDSAALAEDLRH